MAQSDIAATPAAGQMADAARELLKALKPEQRKTLTFKLDDESTRRDWGYFPRRFHGLSLGAMDAKQQKLTHHLVSTALSLHAYSKVTTIIALENVLDLLEGRAGQFDRDPALYFLSIYGSPDDPVWAWQFEGHHISINITIAGEEQVSATPLFLGSNPAEVGHGDRPVLRIMGEEEDAGHELLASLDRIQHARAIIAPVAPPDFVLMNLPRVPDAMLPGEAGGPALTVRGFERYAPESRELVGFDRERPKGIAFGDMQEGQQARFRALLDVYLERLPAELARLQRARLQSAGLDNLHFAWAGESQPRHPHYYRVQGPNLLIEYDNTQNNANHIHAVWRDPTNDFGDDVLRNHLSSGH